MDMQFNTLVDFFKAEDIVAYDQVIPLLIASGVDPRGHWPGELPSLSQIQSELTGSEMAYVQVNERDDVTFISILTGRVILKGKVNQNDSGYPRIWLNKNNGITFADNKSRAAHIAYGKRVRHGGVRCLSGSEFHAMESDSFYGQGSYVTVLLNLAYPDPASGDGSGAMENAISNEEQSLLTTLNQYIDAEFELEQAVARGTPPFSYTSLKAEAKRVVYRQYYRLKIDDDDYKRLLDLKPKMLSLGEPGKPDEEPIGVEVVDLEPNAKAAEIIISCEKQVEAQALGASGQLYLAALPTLKTVRTAVVEELAERTAANQWLLPVAAEIYQYNPLVKQRVTLAPAEYPPNPSQLDAIERGVGTDDFVLVLGPPGTGKTSVILNWVEYFVKQGMRVLVTSQNNKAVDNVLERLAKEDNAECVRLGNEQKVSTSVHPLLIDNCAATIQKKLIGKLNHFKAYLELYHAFHRRLIDCLPQQRDFRQLKDDIEQSHRPLVAQIGSDLEAATAEFARLTQTLNQLDQRYQEIGSKLDYWQNASMFNPLKWIRQPFLKVSAFYAEKERTETKTTLATCTHNVQQLQLSLKQKSEILTQKNTELGDLETQLLDMLPQPLEVRLPELPVYLMADHLSQDSDRIEATINQYLQRAEKISAVQNGWQTVISTERQRSIYKLLLSLVDVVGATCIGINTNKDFKETPFDIVIVDESGQIQIQNLIVPLSRAPRAILVGDHKQLPPVVQDEIVEELEARDERVDLMKQSWFEWLWDHSNEDRQVMLDTQFRCPSVISDYISEAFYDNKYHAGPGMEKKRPLFAFCQSPIVFIDTSGLDADSRKEATRPAEGRTEVMGNTVETELVLAVLEKALGEKPQLGQTNEIGVIVPYANHVKKIQQAITKEKKSRVVLKQLVAPVRDIVASVDSYQGQERELIILCFTRSNAKGNVGFLADWRRLNVAMTRAKNQLIMIGDLSTLAKSGSKQARDAEFKAAMGKLRSFVKERCHYEDARDWLKPSTKKPSTGKTGTEKTSAKK